MDAGAQASGAEELRAFLAQSLPEYMIPAAFAGLAELPLTGSGKFDKDALPGPSRENGIDCIGFRPPSTPIEIKLAAIVAEVLGAETIGADDNFFLIGGDSAAGAQIVIRTRAACGVDLTLWHLFEARSVANLAATSENLRVAKRRPCFAERPSARSAISPAMELERASRRAAANRKPQRGVGRESAQDI